MDREYSDKVYNRLLEQIDEINMTTISPLTDWIGDIFLHVKDFLGLVDLDNVKLYQKELLDKEDVTRKKLKKIFQDVENADIASSVKIGMIVNRQEEYLKKLNWLSGQLKPNFIICSAETLKKGCEQYNKNLSKYDKAIAKEYDTILKNQATTLAFKGAKKAIGGIVSAGVSVVSMPASWASALYVGGPKAIGEAFVSDTWGLINNVFDVGSGLGGVAGVGIVCLFAKNKWTNPTGSDEGIEDMKKMISGKGLTGVLEAEDYPEPLVAFSKGMDTTTELVGFKNKLKDFRKSPEVIKREEAFKKLKKWSEFRREKEMASKIKKIYKVGEKGFDLFEGEDLKNVINKGIATAGMDNIEFKGFKLKDPGDIKDAVGTIFGEDSVTWKDVTNSLHNNANIAHANK